jgi:hypothetical protein
MESEHFVFVATTATSDSTEMTEGLRRAEEQYATIRSIVSPPIVPPPTIHVHLNGDFIDRGPYYDSLGVHLYRYSREEGGYWALLGHEMAHAFAAARYMSKEAWTWTTYRSFDEGWAEYLAQLTDPGKQGFPFYGFPEDIVVGSWVASGQHIPFEVLRERHEELNQPCQHQAYPQRASWFRYVDVVYGRDAALAIAYPDAEPTSPVVESIVGVPLPELDRLWQDWVVARYHAIPNAAARAAAYRARTSFYRPCRAGVHY